MLKTMLLGVGLVAVLGMPTTASAQTFVRGDANPDGVVNIADVISILANIFNAGVAPAEAQDVNDNGVVEISDPVYLLQFLFSGGNPPPPPFPNPGTDTTPPNFPAAPSGNVDFRLGAAAGCQGDQVFLPMFIDNSVTLEAITVRITYNDLELTNLSVDDTPMISILGQQPDFFDTEIQPGATKVAAVFSLIQNINLGPGTNQNVMNFLFTISAAVATGQTVLVDFTDDLLLGFFNLASVSGQAELAGVSGGTIDVNCMATEFRRGDVNEDNAVSISDAIALINFLFVMGPSPNCERTMDCNGDGLLNVADPIALLNALFSSGPTLPGPFPGCGTSSTASAIPCLTYGGTCP